MENMNNIFENANSIVAKTETVNDITVSYYNVPINTKDENGNPITVYKKLRNEVAVSSMVMIEKLNFIRSKSQKALVLSIAKLTKEHAESVGLKSVDALLNACFGKDLSMNTIKKYRRIGLMFSADRNDLNNFEYREGIDADTSISNLDVVMTLFNLKDKEIDIESCSSSEIDAMFADFYGKYIVLDKIHLAKSQTELKKEVHEILNPTIEVPYKEVKTADDEPEDKPEDKPEEKPEPDYNRVEDKAESATNAITVLSVLFRGNKTAEKAIATLIKEIENLQ